MSVTVLRFSRDSQRMSRRISGEFERKCNHGAVSGVASWMDDDRQLGEAGPDISDARKPRDHGRVGRFAGTWVGTAAAAPMLYLRSKTTVMQDSLTAAIV